MTEARPLPFGTSPVPSDSLEMERRITRLLESLAQPGVRGLDGVKVAVEIDGPDLASLRVDATGVSVQDPGASARSLPVGPADVVRREPGTVRSLEVVGHPVTVRGLPAQVDVAASGVGFDWVVGADGQLYVEVRPPSDAAPAVGTGRVAVAHRALVAAVEAALGELLQDKGFTLTGLELDLQNRGPRALDVRADAKIKRSFLRAGVTVTASASIDRSLVLEIGDVAISSSNPVVDGLIGPFRSRVAAEAGRTIDLAAQLPPGVRVSDVSIEAGDDVVVSVTLG
ncbi:hypothetical protein [Cellulomonas xylanilytica]|uniref:DUF2993 domain-containing protein n=1 Tax=Cellulomonas xylanilytica TaxID=233583 RepID=A0A510VEM5_9CELL|nr:hypothetical protein [Cellulomonas xylanilytica]GEK23585.1 hypothetical protein CXY01_41050 [Cellulomonas xylanilytica]